MVETPEFRAMLEQAREMMNQGEFNLMLLRLVRDPLNKRIQRCMEDGTYELKFRDCYCGLNFIHQRPVQCPFLDKDGRYLDVITSLGNTHRVYHCNRSQEMLEELIDYGGD